jgi:hypothetical protein
VRSIGAANLGIERKGPRRRVAVLRGLQTGVSTWLSLALAKKNR